MRRKYTQRKPISLKWGLMTVMVACWVIPIVTIVLVAGILLNHSYERNLRESVSANVDHAMEQTALRLSGALEASKAVSYNGEVRDAYRSYQQSGDRQALYNRVTGYFSQTFSRDADFKAVFLTFNDHPDKLYYYADSYRANSYRRLQHYRTEVLPQVSALLETVDTGIYFLEDEGELYMTRSLMTAAFEPYAELTLLCDTDTLFQPFAAISSDAQVDVTLDGVTFRLSEQAADAGADERVLLTDYTSEFGGHALSVTVTAVEPDLWGAMPGLKWAVLLVLLLGVPLVGGIVLLFYRYVTLPVETLVDAAARVEDGQRGYQIDCTTGSAEFQKLYSHFNSMSLELQRQFERLYREQQALQQAKIKALQSQINPHFLNNTLEIISWEARLAENDRVCAMTEALATMLDAALDRDERSMIALRQELGYVDAYLYIIGQRLGPALHVRKDIDETLLGAFIPRLILQPIVENAVEHDLTPRRGGELTLRVRQSAQRLLLEVAHDGTISPEDRERISALLHGAPDGGTGKVGLRNVRERLTLLYGGRADLTVEQQGRDCILVCISLPLDEV